MTIHSEKVRALKHAREFLTDLLDRKKTPRVPSEIRKQAYWILRHFPHEYDIKIRDDAGKFQQMVKSLTDKK